MVSPTHIWRQAYRTTEMDPQKIRKLLSTHPELAEPDGKPDAAEARRAWRSSCSTSAGCSYAKEEIERHPEGLSRWHARRTAKEAFDKLVKEIDTATAALVVERGRAGARRRALRLCGRPARRVSREDGRRRSRSKRATKFMALHKAALERYESGRRLLGNLIDEVTGIAQGPAADGGRRRAGRGRLAAADAARAPDDACSPRPRPSTPNCTRTRPPHRVLHQAGRAGRAGEAARAATRARSPRNSSPPL